MNLRLKNYKKIRTPFVFLDETGSINSKAERFFGIGMIKCMQPFFLDSSIRYIRQKYKLYDEIKWNTISKAKMAVLKEIIKTIFETPGIYFSSLIINKDDVNFEIEFNNNPYLAYQKFSEELLKNSISQTEILTVLADYIDTPKSVRYEVMVKHQVNQALDRLAIGGIHRVDSKGVNLIQITDLFLGAVVYNYKIDNKLVTGDKNKIKILQYIQSGLKIKSLGQSINVKGFKVFEYNKKGPSS